MLQVKKNCGMSLFRTDGGAEYQSIELQQYLKESGIEHEVTPPYTPQLNGMAERLNRTLIERVRCLLISSGLNNSFWKEAMDYSVYIYNHTPYSGIAFTKTPAEIFNKFTLKRLPRFHVFGSLCYYHVPSQLGDFIENEGDSDHLMQVDTAPDQSLTEIEGDCQEYQVNLGQRRSRRQNNRISYAEDDVEWHPSFGKRPDNKDKIWHEDSLSEEESYFADIMDLFHVCNTASLEDVSVCAKDAANVQAMVSQKTQHQSQKTLNQEDIDMTNSKDSSQSIQKVQDLEEIHSELMEHKMKSALGEPKSFREAFRDAKWQKSMQEEYDSLMNNKTWKLVNKPQG